MKRNYYPKPKRQPAHLRPKLDRAEAQRVDSEGRLAAAQQAIHELHGRLAELGRQGPGKEVRKVVKARPEPVNLRRLTPEQCQAAIVAALAEQGNQATFAQLVELVGVSLNTVKTHCRSLAEQGRVDIKQNVVTLKPTGQLPMVQTYVNGQNHL